MLILWFACVGAQVLLLSLLLEKGRALLQPDGFASSDFVPERLPSVGMVIPAAGARSGMEEALRSLLTQNLPHYRVVFVTAETDDPATPLLRALCGEFFHARHVAAGRASGCGQKNHNLLRGIAELGDTADVYVFCDSTHTAHPDFLRELVQPIAAGETAFSTGYHAVDASDARPVTLAYQTTVILMRLLQAVSTFTQPWGGAMAMSRAAFKRYETAKLWGCNVVDDCSLAALLMRTRGHVRLCPGALLRTPAGAYSLQQWQSWFERQVLFLKFCTPALWRCMGAGLCLFLGSILYSVFLAASFPDPFAVAGLGHLAFLGFFVRRLREFTTKPAPALVWFAAFALNLWMIGRVYTGTLRTRTLRWHDTVYRVGDGGKVLGMERAADF